MNLADEAVRPARAEHLTPAPAKSLPGSGYTAEARFFRRGDEAWQHASVSAPTYEAAHALLMAKMGITTLDRPSAFRSRSTFSGDLLGAPGGKVLCLTETGQGPVYIHNIVVTSKGHWS